MSGGLTPVGNERGVAGMVDVYPVIDLFAGPGGLGEGFCKYQDPLGKTRYRIVLSIEKDAAAHKTLELRSFFRRLSQAGELSDYFRYLRGDVSRQELFARHPREAAQAGAEAWRAELGLEPYENVHHRITEALADKPGPWLLIGGPPCQAYSIAGRSRYRDFGKRWPKHKLYLEYLRVIAGHGPAVFIMENVKGLLSWKLRSNLVFERIKRDLENPWRALTEGSAYNMLRDDGFLRRNGAKDWEYRIFSFARRSLFPNDTDFVIRTEEHGIPQRRHRVILLGVRSDLHVTPSLLPIAENQIAIQDVLDGLPPLRSSVSRKPDSKEAWSSALDEGLTSGAFEGADAATLRNIKAVLSQTRVPTRTGGRFVPGGRPPRRLADELLCTSLQGVCNHETRSHMKEDLWRYVFAACFAEAHGHPPFLRDFPSPLLPKHRSAKRAIRDGTGNFSDRFRVQVRDKPATTITSHLAKDGHYFIHYDPAQCRSLTVREAARIQTFPDDYFFEGNRTQQYTQVGNAVPPLLARQLAAVIYSALDRPEAKPPSKHESRLSPVPS